MILLFVAIVVMLLIAGVLLYLWFALNDYMDRVANDPDADQQILDLAVHHAGLLGYIGSVRVKKQMK